VQPRRVVEFDGESEEVVQLSRSFRKREPTFGPHALTQDVGHLEWQQRWRDDRLTRSECSLVESPGLIAPLLVQYPLDGHRGVYADHDNWRVRSSRCSLMVIHEEGKSLPPRRA
jgi:hypothetical protein